MMVGQDVTEKILDKYLRKSARRSSVLSKQLGQNC